MDTVEPSEINTFYSSCPNCNRWIEFKRKKMKLSIVEIFEQFDIDQFEWRRNK
jgi:hypothetical protein